MDRLYTLLFLLCIIVIPSKVFAQPSQPIGQDELNGPSLSHASNNVVAVAPDGTPYVAFTDDTNNSTVTVKKYDGKEWKQVGVSFTDGYFSMCTALVFGSDGSPYIAYMRSIEGQNFTSSMVRKLVGDNWVKIGLTLGMSVFPSLAISHDDALYSTALSTFNGLSVRKFTNAWENVGDPDDVALSSVTSSKIAFATDGTLYAAYVTIKTKNKVSVQKLVAGKWQFVGNPGFSNPGATNVNMILSADGTPYVAYQDSTLNGAAVVKQFKNGVWTTISPTALSKGAANFINTAMGPDGTLYVTFCDAGANDRPVVKKFSNGSWASIASSYLPTTKATYTSIAVSKNGIPYLTYSDYNLGALAMVKMFANNQWTNLVSGSLSIQSSNSLILKTTQTGVSFVAYDDAFYGGKVSVKQNVSGNWQYVGTPTISATGILLNHIDMSVGPDGTPYVIYRDSSQASFIVKKYNGKTWEALGNNIAPFGSNFFKIAVAPNGTPYIAYDEPGSGNAISVQKFSNGNWTYVGKASLSRETATDINIAIDKNNIPYVAYFDVLFNKLKAERFDGSVWVSMDAEKLTSGTAKYINLITGPDNTPYITFYDMEARKIVVSSFINNSWQAMNGLTGSKNGYYLPKLLFDSSGQQYLAFINNDPIPNGQLFKLVNGSWIDAGSSGLTPYQASNYDINFAPNGDLIYGYINGMVYVRFRPKNSDASPPIINNIFPSVGSNGTVVTISGYYFNNVSSVKIGASNAASFTVTPQGILATVGSGSTGPVNVTTPNGTAVFGQFTYTTPPPIVKSVSPLFGNINSTVTIKGKNFSTIPAKNLVYFGAVTAPVITANDSTLTVQVPVGTTAAPITVTVNQLTAYAAGVFNVTFKSSNSFTPATFALKQNVSDIAQPSFVNVKDMDGDGKPDVIVTGGGTAILSNNSNRDDLAFKASFAEKQGGTFATTGDLDGDGKADLLTASVFINTYKNTSIPNNSSFLPYGQVLQAADYSFEALAGDIDGDGKTDIVSIGNNGLKISVFRNNGTSNNYTFFEDPVTFPYDTFPRGAYLADIDGDGKMDIVLSLPNFLKFDGTGYISILKNTSTTGKLSFTQVTLPSGIYTNKNPQKPIVADIDNDGKPDIVVPNTDSNSISIFKNTSTKSAISFAAGIEFTTDTKPSSVAVADLDGDSLPDIAVANLSNSISILKNISSASAMNFATKIDYKTNYQPGNIIAADLDGDQAPELIVPNYIGNNATIFKNNIIRFSLPITNFTISIVSASCKGSANGAVNIKAAQAFTYTAQLTGNGLSKTQQFTTTSAFNDLPAGTYHLCITIAEESSYEQCYDVVITEPKDLELFSTVNVEDKIVNLAFTGGAIYNINLNGASYTTTNNSISLPLNAGNNKLSVTTDKDCQGIIQKIINLSGVIIPYPVPFQNTLNVNIGPTPVNNILLQLYSVSDGRPVYIKHFTNRTGVLQLDVTGIKTGVYSLHLTLDGNENVFKVIKQ